MSDSPVFVEVGQYTFFQRPRRDADGFKGMSVQDEFDQATGHDDHVYPHFDHAWYGHTLLAVLLQ